MRIFYISLLHFVSKILSASEQVCGWNILPAMLRCFWNVGTRMLPDLCDVQRLYFTKIPKCILWELKFSLHWFGHVLSCLLSSAPPMIYGAPPTSGWCKIEPRHDKTNNVAVRPAKTQISLGIRPVWSESSLSAWRNLGSLATHWAHSEDSDQTGRMPRLIWVFAGRTLILLVLSCRGSIFGGGIKMSHAMRKCVFGSLRQGQTQPGLLSYRGQLESWNFGYIN